VVESWWRCPRCLERIMIATHGYDCPTCKSQCADKRQKIRGTGSGSGSGSGRRT
jgi:Zn finger protein HypA/HybF involved in hydrogenase expression